MEVWLLGCKTVRLVANEMRVYRYLRVQVPKTWNIINDQDTVPRAGKFFFMYKRPGQVRRPGRPSLASLRCLSCRSVQPFQISCI